MTISDDRFVSDTEAKALTLYRQEETRSNRLLGEKAQLEEKIDRLQQDLDEVRALLKLANERYGGLLRVLKNDEVVIGELRGRVIQLEVEAAAAGQEGKVS